MKSDGFNIRYEMWLSDVRRVAGDKYSVNEVVTALILARDTDIRDLYEWVELSKFLEVYENETV